MVQLFMYDESIMVHQYIQTPTLQSVFTTSRSLRFFPEFLPDVVRQIQTFIRELTGIHLSFICGDKSQSLPENLPEKDMTDPQSAVCTSWPFTTNRPKRAPPGKVVDPNYGYKDKKGHQGGARPKSRKHNSNTFVAKVFNKGVSGGEGTVQRSDRGREGYDVVDGEPQQSSSASGPPSLLPLQSLPLDLSLHIFDTGNKNHKNTSHTHEAQSNTTTNKVTQVRITGLTQKTHLVTGACRDVDSDSPNEVQACSMTANILPNIQTSSSVLTRKKCGPPEEGVPLASSFDQNVNQEQNIPPLPSCQSPVSSDQQSNVENSHAVQGHVFDFEPNPSSPLDRKIESHPSPQCEEMSTATTQSEVQDFRETLDDEETEQDCAEEEETGEACCEENSFLPASDRVEDDPVAHLELTEAEKRAKELSLKFDIEGDLAEDLDHLDIQELRQTNRELKEVKLCKVCRDKDANRLFLPCAHIVCCALCTPAMVKCPQCKSCIRGIVSVYFG